MVAHVPVESHYSLYINPYFAVILQLAMQVGGWWVERKRENVCLFSFLFRL